MKIYLAFLILLSSCHSEDKSALSKLAPNELRGNWQAKRDTISLQIIFIDSNHLKMPSLSNQLMTYQIIPKSDYSLFIIKGDEDSSSSVSYISRRINENKISMELSMMRYFEPFKKIWIEKTMSKEAAKVQYWEKVK